MLFYSLGWTDPVIARQDGVTVMSIKKWRNRNGLRPNRLLNGKLRVPVKLETVLARIRRAVGRALPRDIADDAVGDMIAALLSGELPIEDVEREARRYGNRVLERFADRFKGPRSLDEQIGAADDGFTMMDMMQCQSSRGWLEEMGATVW